MSSDLKSRISGDTKTSMRARDRRRLGVLRLVNAAIKQVEIDKRVELEDEGVLGVLDRMLKQRRESLDHYTRAERADLAEQEAYEIAVIEAYMPQPLSETELDALIEQTVTETGAAGMRDMGKVMGKLTPLVKGRADMRSVSEKVKSRLS